jgi:hypothetical protein
MYAIISFFDVNMISKGHGLTMTKVGLVLSLNTKHEKNKKKKCTKGFMKLYYENMKNKKKKAMVQDHTLDW